MDKNVELRANTIGLEKTDYDALPVNENNVKKAIGVPDGMLLEVFNNTTGKIEIYGEAINELWFER
ncbi:MAG: hypothetical protein MJ151_01795 [Lachnospiraceae bacterium]|nr:hypothetical protein [Lachnospiraceae bacterium]